MRLPPSFLSSRAFNCTARDRVKDKWYSPPSTQPTPLVVFSPSTEPSNLPKWWCESSRVENIPQPRTELQHYNCNYCHIMTTATVSVPPPLGVSQPGLAHSAKLLPATKSANPLDTLPIGCFSYWMPFIGYPSYCTS